MGVGHQEISMNILRESMTKITILPFVIRVWRQEKDLTVELDNDDIWLTAKEAVDAKYANQISIAYQLLSLDRVNAVEVVDECGAGEVLYKDWP